MTRFFVPCFLFLLLLSVAASAQLTENFSDGNFSDNPVWAGNTADFDVNSSLQLQSINSVANSSFFLSTPNSLSTNAEWEMYVGLGFNPSSANYVDVYLISSGSDFTLAGNTGYFVRIGNTDDEVSLYRKDAGAATEIIDGLDGVLNKSSNTLKIKITRNVNNLWILSTDPGGTGNLFTTEGSVTDATYTTSAFFGFLIRQSTASFFQQHIFDDIEISNYVPDIVAPAVQSAIAVSPTSVDVLFSETVQVAGAEMVTNYSVDNNVGSPVSALSDATNPSLIHLLFASPFSNGVVYTLAVNGVSDLAGNMLNNGTASFSYYTPQQYDIVIDEIMPDPTPPVGLPASEWIELKNRSSFAINLQGWKIADRLGSSGPMPNFILQPDSFVIVCTGSAAAALIPFGNVITVTSFPSLDNDRDLLWLSAGDGKTIHAVEYNTDWYQNELKKDGGWTLEMIDVNNPCSGISNWTASIAGSGGTPGKINSVNGISVDDASPKILRAFATSDTTITLVFDEPLDSLSAAAPGIYTIDNGVAAQKAESVAPLFNRVNILLSMPLNRGTVYTILAPGTRDCIGNTIGLQNTARFGLAEDATPFDVVINEILFDPRPSGADYVELYNRSQKIIDLRNIYIANRNSSNAISSIQQVTTEPFLFFPGDYLALTADVAGVKAEYIANDQDAFLELNSMPSYPDDQGHVIILNNQGKVLDEVSYDDNWHFALIANTEGVSLERIDYDGPSIQGNFHSAATSAGYGTPGYKNSQYKLNEMIQGEIKVSPEVFSPDNDGIDDYATITYKFPSPGYVTNISVFDATGRLVRYLQRNSLSGVDGYFRWDGLDDKGRSLPQGIYIIYTEIFNTDGKKRQFKNPIVLARRY